MVRLLVLILASDTDEVYLKFQDMWREVISCNPTIPFYFYKGDPNLATDYQLVNDTLFIKCEETLQSVYEKTFKAFKYFENELDKFDYVLRPNLSSFYYFPTYMNILETLPRTNCCAAYRGGDEKFYFPSGAGMTFSPDLIKKILIERPTFECQDDITIGLALKKWNIPILPLPRFDPFIGVNIMVVDVHDTRYFHYRLKNVFGNRQLDIDMYGYLIMKYYNAM